MLRWRTERILRDRLKVWLDDIRNDISSSYTPDCFRIVDTKVYEGTVRVLQRLREYASADDKCMSVMGTCRYAPHFAQRAGIWSS